MNVTGLGGYAGYSRPLVKLYRYEFDLKLAALELWLSFGDIT